MNKLNSLLNKILRVTNLNEVVSENKNNHDAKKVISENHNVLDNVKKSITYNNENESNDYNSNDIKFNYLISRNLVSDVN